MAKYPDFPRDEYERRYARAWKLMRKHRLDGLLVTSESNYRYFTGHRSQFWVSNARPFYAVMAPGRRPVALVTVTETEAFRASSWLPDVRTWLGFADDSLPFLTDILGELGLKRARVGVDFGLEMRLGLPLTTFRRLEAMNKGVRFVDASPMLWEQRLIKSAGELAYIKKACAAADKGMKAGWRFARVGMPERDVRRHMAARMIEAGADKVGWLPLTAGPGNYKRFTMDPTGRRLKRGDVIWTDAGCSVNGYWSDFNRVAAVGAASPAQRRAYRVVRELTHEVLAKIRAGVPASEVAAENARAHKRRGIDVPGNIPGRVGHGSGMDMTEPPSIAPFDSTPLKAGMVIHIEPKMIYDYGPFQLEEVVAVTESGYEFLAPPAPKALPVAG
jgi:Xaa-Pro aminopeptidase